MDENRLYFKILEEKHSDLLKVAFKKKYQFLAPSNKYISHTMLNKVFYENHIFFQSDYDPTLFVSLSGKVLQQNLSEIYFQSYIGFKKYMKFNVIGEGMREINVHGVSSSCTIKVTNIDNVIDETCYNPPSNALKESMIKKDILVRYDKKEEYIQFYKSAVKSNNYEFREVEVLLNESCKRIINDYILIKRYLLTFSRYFKEAFTPIKDVRIILSIYN